MFKKALVWYMHLRGIFKFDFLENEALYKKALFDIFTLYNFNNKTWRFKLLFHTVFIFYVN